VTPNPQSPVNIHPKEPVDGSNSSHDDGSDCNAQPQAICVGGDR
jgi:hypothetical protein